jgi:hypothetical protein
MAEESFLCMEGDVITPVAAVATCSLVMKSFMMTHMRVGTTLATRACQATSEHNSLSTLLFARSISNGAYGREASNGIATKW